MNPELTRQERLLRTGLIVLSATFLGFIGWYLYKGFSGAEGAGFPFVANAATKDGLFFAIAAVAIADIRRYVRLTLLVIYGHVLLIIFLGLMVLTHHTSGGSLIPLGSEEHGARTALTWAGTDVLVVALFSWLYVRAWRSTPRERYLLPFELATLRMLSDVLIPDAHRVLDSRTIAANVDRYLGSFRAKSKWRVRLALWAMLLLFLVPRRQRQRFVLSQLGAEGKSRFKRVFLGVTQPVVGVGAQLVYLAYYDDPRTFDSVGFVRFKDRGHEDGLPIMRAPLKTMDPDHLRAEELEADIVIIGSGAAGAIIAYEAARRDKNRSVLVIERGSHVDPSKFTDCETEMLSNLYSDGAIQVSRDLRFAVLQGMCVGGSTVVNNAVCIAASPEVLDRWNDPAWLNAGLDLARLQGSFKYIGDFLPITEQPSNVFGNNAAAFRAGAEAVGLGDAVGVVDANIQDCRGCGYCNIGCAFGSKLSMLDRVLPAAQSLPGEMRVRILPTCEAQRIEMDRGHAVGVRCKLDNGQTVRVRANERYVVSAGAIGSSLLLQRSRIRSSAAGAGLSFNMATPLTAYFGETLNSYAEQQISHYLRPPDDSDYVLETWFNPPAMQSLFMPGWGERHFQNMRNYAHMGCAGVVAGTESNGSVGRGLTADFDFTPKREDVAKVIKGAQLLGEMFLEAGAEKVMPSTLHYEEYRSKQDLQRLNHFLDHPTGISLNSAHPQGGNAICKDPRRGVVDPDFLVRGTDNVHVCDASVFPSSITVNPQWTVMALAHYASGRWFGPPPSPPEEEAEIPVSTEVRERLTQPAETSTDQPAATDST